MVGTVIFVGAVAIVFAIRFVVLALIADQIREREPIVYRDVVHARPRPATIVIEQIGGAGHAAAELANEIALAGPVATQRSAEAVVPFRPPRGEAADLITAGTKVPRLGDQFDSRQNGILPDGRKERDAAVKPIGTAAERGREIEPESVDVANLDPVTQGIHHQ